jgi:hypothetical protein
MAAAAITNVRLEFESFMSKSWQEARFHADLLHKEKPGPFTGPGFFHR